MDTTLKHIYWFAPYDFTCASTRYRGHYPIEMLSTEYGISSDFAFPTRNLHGIILFFKMYFSILFFRKKNSVIVIQKICSNRIYSNLLKILITLRPSKTLYDLDDAEYLRQDTKTLHYFLKKCQAVSVGSEALRKYCKGFNSQTVILTSPVLKHGQQKEKRNKLPNNGWVGDLGNGNAISKDFSHKTAMFDILFPQLIKLKRPIKLSLIGVTQVADIKEITDYFKDTPSIRVEIPQHLNWKDDRWIYKKIRYRCITTY